MECARLGVGLCSMDLGKEREGRTHRGDNESNSNIFLPDVILSTAATWALGGLFPFPFGGWS